MHTRPAAAPAHLRRALRATEYFTIAFGSMIGVGWVIVMDDWLGRGGPGGAILGFLAGGLALVPVAYVYGRLTERFADAGSEVAYAEAVFPRVMSFAVGWLMLLAYVIVPPWEAVAIGRLVAYLASDLNTLELYRVADQPVYLPHLALGLALTAAITAVNYCGVRPSTTLQNLATFGLLAIFCVFVVLGTAGGDMANLQPLFANEGTGAGALVSTLLVLQIVPYFLTGFEAIPKCSEEAAADFNPRSYTAITILALAVGTLFYVVVVGVVALLYPWRELTEQPFATAFAFERAFGSPLVAKLIIAAAILSLVKVFNGMFLSATRLLFALARRGYVPAGFGVVNERFGTPTRAILAVGLFTALAAPLGRAILIPITEVGSLAAAVGWLGTCLAFVCGAGKLVTPRTGVVAVAGAVVAAVMVVMKLLPTVPGGFSIWELVALGAWFTLGAACWISRILFARVSPDL
jgi:amino acid transporter